jgi:hypothetical protein
MWSTLNQTASHLDLCSAFSVCGKASVLFDDFNAANMCLLLQKIQPQHCFITARTIILTAQLYPFKDERNEISSAVRCFVNHLLYLFKHSPTKMCIKMHGTSLMSDILAEKSLVQCRYRNSNHH